MFLIVLSRGGAGKVPGVDFSDQLASLRRERGLTQAQLAERVGIHQSQLHRYEAGIAQPTLDVLRRIAVALSVSADSLVFADEARTLVEGRLSTAFETTMYLTEHEQVIIAEVIEAFVAASVAKSRPNKPRGPIQTRRRSPP
jgi:transcriptional regulator with XRE-family HTH domain